MQTIQRAALAPAEPSSADRRIASRASAYANEARTDILQSTQEDKEAPKELKKAQGDGEADQRTQDSEDSSVNTAQPDGIQSDRQAKTEQTASDQTEQGAPASPNGTSGSASAQPAGGAQNEAKRSTAPGTPAGLGVEPETKEPTPKTLPRGYSRSGQGVQSGAPAAKFNVFA